MQLTRPTGIWLLVCTGLCLLAVVAPTAHADTLTGLLDRIRITETRHFSYRETRHMQLMAEPWQASGDMYISPTQMIIAQQTPTEVKTFITADRMQHVDKARDIDRSLTLARPFAVPGMEPFLQLLYGSGDRASLEREYRIMTDADEQDWTLQLTPRGETEHGVTRLLLSGNSDSGPDHMVLQYEDGDRTEWQLTLRSRGEQATQDMQHALAGD